jgi:hypothetical protein
MNLDDEKKKLVSGWIAEGLKLSDIQKRLATECGLQLTYMEVRLLVDDLRLVPKDPPPKVEKTLMPQSPPSRPGAPAHSPGSEQGQGLPSSRPGETGAGSSPSGGVTVAVDNVARPGAMVSGSVTFSDGQVAVWYLDQFGQTGIAPKQRGYKPTQADLQSFQQALDQELAKYGY